MTDPKRKAVSKRLRFEVFKRDEFTCRYCGRKPPAVILNVDHIVPVVEGGGDEISNLATSCFDCNSGKSGVPLGQLPQPVADLRAQMVEREEQERAYIEFVRARRHRQDELIEEIGGILFGEGYTFWPAGASTCRYFLERLPYDDIIYAAERACGAHSPLKYFCGICWNKIRATGLPYSVPPNP